MGVLCLLALGAAAPAGSAWSATKVTNNPPVAPPVTTPTKPTTIPSNWQWIAFPDAFCANGTTTGIGVNLHSASTRVMIYLEEGGACWSYQTCYVQTLAANFLTGYGAANFAGDSGPGGFLTQAGGFFDRTAAGNPYKDDNYVFIPYCTGDLHSGNNTVAYDSTHTAMHVGYANMTLFLQRIATTFPSATKITLMGSSAGGYGALVNWDQTLRLFSTVPVDLVDDSGTPIPAAEYPTTGAQWQAQSNSWNLAGTLPPGCPKCLTQGLTALFSYYSTAYPTAKAAFLTYQQDTVLPFFFNLTPAQWQVALTADAATIASVPNFRYFAAPGPGHVLLSTPTLISGTTSLQQWLTRMTTGEAAWINEP